MTVDAVIFNSFGEPIISGVVDVVHNFWTSYGGIDLIVTSAIAGLCLVAIVILGIKHQRLYAMFLVLHNERGVNGEDVLLFSFLYSANDCDSDNDDKTTQSFWSPYEIENYICVLVILYVLYKIYKFFSQRGNKSEHGFNLGLDINGKCGNVLLLNLITLKVVSRNTV